MTVSREAQAKIDKLQLEEDFKFVVNDPRGRRVLNRILQQCSMFNLSFAGENPHTTSFNEGKRNVGLYINAEILKHSPEQWANIMGAK